jgi:hypothetical protein
MRYRFFFRKIQALATDFDQFDRIRGILTGNSELPFAFRTTPSLSALEIFDVQRKIAMMTSETNSHDFNC